MDSGLSAASSVRVMVPLREPAAAGVNVVVIVHMALAARVVPQLFDEVKSAAWVPATTMLAMFSVALPVLVTVTACDGLVTPTFSFGKARPVAERLTMGAAAPVPLTAAVCGLA